MSVFVPMAKDENQHRLILLLGNLDLPPESIDEAIEELVVVNDSKIVKAQVILNI
jgi:hypothetical protein